MEKADIPTARAMLCNWRPETNWNGKWQINWMKRVPHPLGVTQGQSSGSERDGEIERWREREREWEHRWTRGRGLLLTAKWRFPFHIRFSHPLLNLHPLPLPAMAIKYLPTAHEGHNEAGKFNAFCISKHEEKC